MHQNHFKPLLLTPFLIAIIFAALFLMSGARTSAQDPAVCPPNALLSYVRAGAVCQQTGRDEFCYGNGTASATFQGTDPLTFETPGDLIAAGFTESIAVTTENLDAPNYAIVQMLLRADTLDTEERAVTLLPFGNATVTNGVPPVLELPVTARGTLNIRDFPAEQQTEILEQIFVREQVFAHGRTEEGDWLRVTVPGTLELGWVATDIGIVDGNPLDLPVVDGDTPYLRPFQIMAIETNSSVGLCGDGIVDGGVLLQTPNPDDEVLLTINDSAMRIAGTVYIESDGEQTRYTVLEGIINVDDELLAPAGTEFTTPDAELMPLASTARLQALPVNNLPTRVQIPDPATEREIETRIAVYRAVPPTPIPVPTVPDNQCRYTVRRDGTVLRAGPASFYEAINELNAGIELAIVLQTNDADGGTWYQLRNNNWLNANAISQSGDCDPIPRTDFVEAPRTNTIQMETCEASNGPLREGQIVTFEFRPPAADNYEEMLNAVNTDPGSLKVENEVLRVRYTDPILIASEPERWARIYSATWEAQAGSYRVESARLSYILICELTVRAG